MASRMMVWAVFGKPNQREWVPSTWSKEQYPKNDGIYSSGYRLISAQPSESLKTAIVENELVRTASKSEPEKAEKKNTQYKDRLWKGWVLPASEADDWFTAGSAAYYRDLQSDDLAKAMPAHWAAYRSARIAEPNAMNKFAEETHRGALVLDQMRRDFGDDRFLKLLTDFFSAHTTQTVTGQSFLDAAGVKVALPEDLGGAVYLASDIGRHLATAIIVYGTVTDAGANRYAAEQLQKHYLDSFENAVPLRKDFDASDDELRSHDVIFVGRAETNSALAAWKEKIGLESDGGQFRIAGKEHASETEAIAFAASNPLEQHHMVLVLAGNNALETVHLASAWLNRTEYTIYDSAKETSSGFR
jgi:hypothetical protein